MRRRRGEHPAQTIPLWAAVLVLIVTSILPYLPAIQNGAVLDDGALAWSHPAVRGLPGYSAWSSPYAWGESHSPWRPLATATLAWNFGGAGANRQAYYVTHVALRVLAGLLLFLILWRLLRNTLAAFLWSLLAAVHPASSEAVFRLAGRGELLGMVFVLGALLAYVWSWAPAGQSQRPARSSLSASVVIWLCYGLALVSFAQAWILPFLLLGGEWVRARAKGDAIRRDVVLQVAPMAGLLVVWTVLRLGHSPGQEGDLVYGVLPWMGLFRKLVNSVALIGTYSRLFVFPLDLSTSHVHILAPGGMAKIPHLIVGLAITVLLVLAVRLAVKRRWVIVGWGLLWWPLGLLPCLPFLRRWGNFASEMFLLLPAVGLVLALAVMTRRWIPGPKGIGVIVLGVVCVAFGIRTAARGPDFRSDATLLEVGLRTHPRNAEFLYQKGTQQLAESNHAVAQTYFLDATDALEIDPRVWVNLGITFHEDETYSLALRSLFKAAHLIEKGPQDPTLAYRVYYHLGLFLKNQDRYQEASQYLEKALELRPRSLPVLVNLGFVYAQVERFWPRALELLNRALELERDPKKAEEIRGIVREIEDLLDYGTVPRR